MTLALVDDWSEVPVQDFWFVLNVTSPSPNDDYSLDKIKAIPADVQQWEGSGGMECC